MRAKISAIPDVPRQCRIVEPCVYRGKNKNCDEPRTNKGNHDAACHKMLNKYVVTMLTPNV